MAVAAVLHRVERILHQVVDHLAQLGRVAADQRRCRIELGAQSATLLVLGVKRQHVGHQLVQVQGFQGCRRQAGIVAELVDQLLHRLHLVDDGGDGTNQHRLIGAFQLRFEFVLQPLG